MGDKYLRKLFIVGMTSLVRRAKYNPKTIDPRLADLLTRKPMRLATVAMANKTARIIWAIMVRGETYRAGHQRTGRITITIHDELKRRSASRGCESDAM